jgi:hypothetical protein
MGLLSRLLETRQLRVLGCVAGEREKGCSVLLARHVPNQLSLRTLLPPFVVVIVDAVVVVDVIVVAVVAVASSSSSSSSSSS